MKTNERFEDIEEDPSLSVTSDQNGQLVVHKNGHLMDFLISSDFPYTYASMTRNSASKIEEKVPNCTLDNYVVMDLGQQCGPIFQPHFHRPYLLIGFL